MKQIIVRTGLLLAIPLLFSTCHKLDWDFFGSHGKNDCQVQAYYLSRPELPYPFLFEKKFNRSLDRVTEINCSFNNVTLPEDRVHFDLRIVYNGDKVYLINKSNSHDTTLKVFLNAQGRVRETIGNGGHFTHNKFYYKDNKLRVMTYSNSESTFRDTCIYDNRGNILSITRAEIWDGLRVGYFFQYDYSRKAKQQFYFDEIRDQNNDFALLQYLGCFPELEPVNVRTHVRHGLEVGAAVYVKDLINHRFDAKGKLLGYDVVSPGGEVPVDLYYTATLNWKCK